MIGEAQARAQLDRAHQRLGWDVAHIFDLTSFNPLLLQGEPPDLKPTRRHAWQDLSEAIWNVRKTEKRLARAIELSLP